MRFDLGRAEIRRPHARAQFEQTAALLQDIGVAPTTAKVDLGYRGADAQVTPVQVLYPGKCKTLTNAQRGLIVVPHTK